ncbi:olfactory receptor 10AG1-like [Gracilinanus agilis]|uniref:olfactory receptor 10AG1-like n=1 Tax=Gracilinanus agilis TaxID=191870 RepID=UPI001CFDA8DB|nr:olfactory receptor 10AG1-like [Gracilinanus agilis]
MEYTENKMAERNITNVEEFILLGFSDMPNLQGFLFGFFLVIYVSILLGNGLIITLAKVAPALQTPMYFFLGNLSFLEICYTSVTLPRILSDLWTQKRNITLLACATQLCFFLILAGTECLLLAVMAYDRYVAICRPLYYPLLMNHRMCICLVIGSWLAVIPAAIWQIYQIFSLPFCGSKILNHIFCDTLPLLMVVCGNTSVIEFTVYGGVALYIMLPFILIIRFYVKIIATIVKLPSAIGRFKAFSTCTSHLTVVFLFYGSEIIGYSRPKSNASGVDKVLSLFYTIVTPMFNPIIYSLRNKDVIAALRKLLSKRFCS